MDSSIGLRSEPSPIPFQNEILVAECFNRGVSSNFNLLPPLKSIATETENDAVTSAKEKRRTVVMGYPSHILKSKATDTNSTPANEKSVQGPESLYSYQIDLVEDNTLCNTKRSFNRYLLFCSPKRNEKGIRVEVKSRPLNRVALYKEENMKAVGTSLMMSKKNPSNKNQFRVREVLGVREAKRSKSSLLSSCERFIKRQKLIVDTVSKATLNICQTPEPASSPKSPVQLEYRPYYKERYRSCFSRRPQKIKSTVETPKTLVCLKTPKDTVLQAWERHVKKLDVSASKKILGYKSSEEVAILLKNAQLSADKKAGQLRTENDKMKSEVLIKDLEEKYSSLYTQIKQCKERRDSYLKRISVLKKTELSLNDSNRKDIAMVLKFIA
eukprot:TRINITY_DN12180_c0_g2_i1.p1 TRINITY_DN12180_c0_g2~~TRINITY_DN12180_c0_g2_i1.p1  ORF type:complete len:384 (-),score=68.47 TRINITY_DN12180_c0_g2_i1:55-1206(-)